MGASLLLIEDDDDIAELVGHALQTALPACAVRHVRTLRDGLGALSDHTDCVVLDYRLPDGDGLDGLRTIRRRNPSMPVVMLTGAGSEAVAVEAMKLGAADYLIKQGRFVDAVPATVRIALGQRAMAERGSTPASDGRDSLDARTREYCAAAHLVGDHPAFLATLASARRAAESAAPVLLEGESGTGKERIARLIHDLGPRHAAPFVAINCAALPEALLESELFGHARGAFSGADRDHRGLIESATGGTLFLDEIAELPLAVQPKLLRVLQEQEVRQVGAIRSRRVDVRIIAASNRELALAVAARQFRNDLFHRLHVLPIRLPPLRERRSDLALLASHFSALLAEREHMPPLVFTAEALAILEHHTWPGNVRELGNLIHGLLLALPPGARIDARHLEHLKHERYGAPTSERPLKDIVRDVEAAAVDDRLRWFGYSRTATARSLGLTREGLWHKLRQLGLDPPRGRTS